MRYPVDIDKDRSGGRLRRLVFELVREIVLRGMPVVCLSASDLQKISTSGPEVGKPVMPATISLRQEYEVEVSFGVCDVEHGRGGCLGRLPSGLKNQVQVRSSTHVSAQGHLISRRGHRSVCVSCMCCVYVDGRKITRI